MEGLEVFSWDKKKKEAGKCLRPWEGNPKEGVGVGTSFLCPRDRLVAQEDSCLSIVMAGPSGRCF